MPIEVDGPIEVLDEQRFHTLAKEMIGLAFGVHNELGRLLDEDVYKQCMLRRARTSGEMRREVKITVSHREFLKHYFMDLFYQSGLMIEAKTAEKLYAKHEAQTLNYLLLTGMNHGLLLNFRTEKVEKRFVSTHLTATLRHQFQVDDGHWREVNQASRELMHSFIALVEDIGLFLHVSLYRDARACLFNRPNAGRQRIEVFDKGQSIGSHEVCLLSVNTAVAVTSLQRNKSPMRSQLQRFLRLTHLKYLQWINLNHHIIEFTTLSS